MDNKKRNPIQFIIRLGSFILIVILLQYYLIGPLSMQKEIRNFSQRNQLNRAIRDQREIIFFGDSTMGALGRNDRDKRPIGKMLEDRLKEKVSMIAGSAYSMEIYHAFCTYLKAHAERLPRWIIIPINLRSFSPVWDQNPDWQFEKEIAILKGGFHCRFYKPMRILKLTNQQMSHYDYLNLAVYFGSQKSGYLKDYKFIRGKPKYNIRNRFLIQYLGWINSNHRKIESMTRIINLFKGTRSRLLFYLTPIDYQTGRIHFRHKFIPYLKRNTELIGHRFHNQDCHFLDLSRQLTMDAFAWRRDRLPNEHLNESGRQSVASALEAAIRSYSN